MPPQFTKFHGFGNDYIVIESTELAAVSQPGDFARRICDRHYGAGADGIAVLSPSEIADFHVRIFNPDGSEASLSGNGTRCAAAYLYYKQLWTAKELRLSTRAGVKLYTLKGASGSAAAGKPSTPADRKTSAGDATTTPTVPARRYVFDSELGQPKFDAASIPMITEEPMERVVDYQLDFEGGSATVTALQMGNPNCCIFVDDFDEIDWRQLGRRIETHHQFPERTNVVFVRVQDRHTIELRIWERGVGETQASGTCSCAAAVAATVKGLTERVVDVLMPGGKAKICWRGGGTEESGEVVLTGTAELIYSGEWLTAAG
jgi:diaminopimelate epimerase